MEREITQEDLIIPTDADILRIVLETIQNNLEVLGM